MAGFRAGYRIVGVVTVLMLGACAFPDSVLPPAAPHAAAKPAAPAAAPAPKPEVAAAAKPEAAPAETRKPFVVIRFETPDPDFARPLYDAMRGALQRRPGAVFDLVAVTGDAAAAERNLARVTHALTAMGMPAARLSLAAAAPAAPGTDEVWIYVR